MFISPKLFLHLFLFFGFLSLSETWSAGEHLCPPTFHWMAVSTLSILNTVHLYYQKALHFPSKTKSHCLVLLPSVCTAAARFNKEIKVLWSLMLKFLFFVLWAEIGSLAMWTWWWFLPHLPWLSWPQLVQWNTFHPLRTYMLCFWCTLFSNCFLCAPSIY